VKSSAISTQISRISHFMDEHKTSFRDLLACFRHHSWNFKPDQGESKSPKHRFLMQPHWPWLCRQSKSLKTRSEVLKALQTFKISVPIYQSPWCNIPKDMNRTAKTMVFGSIVSTLFKEMVQFSQTMVFNSNLPKGIVQADMCAFIHHKYFKSHMKSSLYHKRST